MTSSRRLTLAGAVALLALAGCSAAPSEAGGDKQTHHHHAEPARSGGPGGRLVVHADEQLRATFGILTQKFEAAYPGTDVQVEFGTSGEHARHIVDGAAVDVMISGDAAATARVVDRGAARGEPTVIARNPLVVAVARKTTGVNGVADLGRTEVRVAVCAAGTRCGDAARTLVEVRPAMVLADGRAAVAAVQSGRADAALVYRTDIAAAEADVRTVDFPAGVKHADQYAVVRLGKGGNHLAAEAFVAFTHSALAQRVLSDEGFSPA